MADPVGAADALRRRVSSEISEVADVAGTGGPVYVSWFAAQEADACPARFASKAPPSRATAGR